MKLLGLIGYPLTHSFSKQWFSDKFLREKQNDIRYDNFPLQDITTELSELLDALPALCGFNITAPYKEIIISHIDEIDPVAAEIGAVNCVTRFEGILKGYNVDWIGFTRSLIEFIGDERPAAMILGTGGAAKAAAYALTKLNIDYIFVSRNPVGMSKSIDYKELTPEIMSSRKLIINATPLGTYPSTETSAPIPYDLITPQHFLYDMVYNPSLTTFMKKGKSVGAAVTNGQQMLELQAEESWKLFENAISYKNK